MSKTQFHLAWFLNFIADEWNDTWGAGGDNWDGGFYIEMARALERAGFDYVILEDKLMVSDAYGGTLEMDLKHGVTPKHDPVPLATLLAYCTSRLGVVATMSTSFYPPWLLARLSATIDHLSGGRFGWNIVTSAEDRAAQNFGLDRLYEHDHRYEMAHESSSWSWTYGDRGSPTQWSATVNAACTPITPRFTPSTSKVGSTSPGDL